MSRSDRRPTLASVAQAAGVSVATVSNALNGTGRLGEETRQRVLHHARAMAYTPSLGDAAASRGRAGVLGLTMASFGDAPVSYTQIDYYAGVMLSALAAATGRGYLLVVVPASLPPRRWLTVELDGVIHTEPRLEDPVAAVLRQRQLPVVSLGRPPLPAPSDAWIEADIDEAVRLLLDHLAAAGARRVGLALPVHDDAYPDLVERSWTRRCAGLGLDGRVEPYALEPHYAPAELGAMGRLLTGPSRPDALVGVYSDSGQNALLAAAEHGLNVPHDLLVGCLTDDAVNRTCEPAVTAVDLRPEELGAQAVDLLLAVLNRRRGAARTRLVAPRLVVRGSTQAVIRTVAEPGLPDAAPPH